MTAQAEKTSKSDTIFDRLGLLTPWEIDLENSRVGRKGDGGYVVADQIRPKQAVLSYGIADEVSFDVELADAGFKVWQFDHTIPNAPVEHRNITFTREGVAEADKAEEDLFTIETHAERLGIDLDGAILKMDVEGAEWEVFETISEDTLGRFDQIFLELHGLGRLPKPRFARIFTTVMEKLNAQFTLFHVHANNARPLVPIENFFVPGLLEVSFVRTNLVARRSSETWYPTNLDFPNVAKRDDLNLWLYPFAPVSSKPVQRL